MENDIQITCRELSSLFGVDYLQASSIIKFLLKQGVAVESEKNKGEGRGRPTIRYKIPETVTINFTTGKCTTH